MIKTIQLVFFFSLVEILNVALRHLFFILSCHCQDFQKTRTVDQPVEMEVEVSSSAYLYVYVCF